MNPACDFCEHRCRPGEGHLGRCGVRMMQNGKMATLYYGDILKPAYDPVEKKPFYHFRPGSKTLSIAMLGCNFTCTFCQNYSISQREFHSQIQTLRIKPHDIVPLMKAHGINLAAYTYSEPTVWQDFMINCAKEVKHSGGENLMVTNGFFTPEALGRMTPWIDGFNIDLKGGPDFYHRICGGRQEPILRNIKTIAALTDKVLEVTTLFIEEEHSREEILHLGAQLQDAGVQIWHLSLFYPAFRMKHHSPTQADSALELYELIKTKVQIPYIYLGNIGQDPSINTQCPHCRQILVRRQRPYTVLDTIHQDTCPHCQTRLYGRF